LLEQAVWPTVERRVDIIFLYPLVTTLGTGPGSTWAFTDLTPTTIAFLRLTRLPSYGDNTIGAEFHVTLDPDMNLQLPTYTTWNADGTPTALLAANGTPIPIILDAPTHLYELITTVATDVALIVEESR
jgi:hypothetical protein